MKLLNVDTIGQVREKLKINFNSIVRDVEMIGISGCVGRHVAGDIFSDIDMPGFRRSVVDGYAVQAKDTFGVSDSLPVFLNVVGAVEMGRAFERSINAGEAAYVPTGGMIPDGADAVVMIEYIDHLDERTIAVGKPAAPNSGIMNKGDDFSKGELLFRSGHRLKVKDIGVLAACGLHRVPVYRKPIVSIVSTGDELVAIDEVPGTGQIRDINGSALGALVEAVGAAVGTYSLYRDDFNGCREHIAKEMANCDLVLVSGGSSAGNKDMTADIIGSLGLPGVFTHGIAIKPGKPTIVGNADGKPIFGLPGHPVSAIIVFKAIVEPFIKSCYFENVEEPMVVQAVMAENIHAGEGRETFQLVTLEKSGAVWRAEPIRAKSGAISQLMKADGYIRIDSLTEGVDTGAVVDVVLL